MNKDTGFGWSGIIWLMAPGLAIGLAAGGILGLVSISARVSPSFAYITFVSVATAVSAVFSGFLARWATGTWRQALRLAFFAGVGALVLGHVVVLVVFYVIAGSLGTV